MMFRPHTIALAISMLFAGPSAWADVEVHGKRIDNGRIDLQSIPRPAEVQPAIAYPMPSGVTRAEASEMRNRAAQVPAAPADLSKALQEAKGLSLFVSGKADLTPSAKESLDALVAEIHARKGVIAGMRIAIVGHTDNQRLSPNAKRIFTDNQGLSEARALTVAAYLKQALKNPAITYSIDGKGESQPLASNATPEGMARNRRVALQVWFDVAAPVVALPKPAPCSPQAASQMIDAPFRITIDGEPFQGNETNEADGQRCTDVALERADIQVRYDSLAIAPTMNIWATPNAAVKGQQVEFRAWSNYIPWLKKAELRLFKAGQKTQEKPFEVLPVSWSGVTQWTAPAVADDQVFYLLRVYDEQGRFDETSLKSLNLLNRAMPANEDKDKIERERLTGYGENSLALRNIPVTGGTITVNGTHMQPGQRVAALGLDLPVDANGKFAMKQIMPAGPQSVEVTVTEADGRANSFRRNLNIAANDWFYLALGDLTVGQNKTSGPIKLVTGDNGDHYDNKVYVDGRAAFYLKGKIKGEYLLTASADTREGPFKDLFSNFSSKDPKYLLRSIDPNLYYPVYGDDSTTVDDAPTQGKFYVKLQKGDSHVLWGNFKTTWSGTELMQYSRGLYGAQLRHRSEEATTYGEKQTQVDAFLADPGTLSSREEFRGTGGSLYYLRHLDITQGSERVWVEVRDKDSGMVIERRELAPAQDYEINYLQGRILLQSPLSSTGGSASLIMTSAVSGNPVYLVTTYEYAPGVTAINNLSTGFRGSQWLNDHVQLGISSYHQGEDGTSQTLKGIDGTFRYKPGTWIKFEAAQSKGPGSGSQTSLDGGFGFNSLNTGTNKTAGAQRVEAAVDLAEVTDDMKGKFSAYAQNRERGYSAPGQIGVSGEAIKQHGVNADVEIVQGTRLLVKADQRNGDLQDSQNLEVAVRQTINPEWDVAVGARMDDRSKVVANASPLLSQTGSRTDAQVRVGYKPERKDGKAGEKDDWEAYGFVQATLEHDATRDANNRVGVGGSLQVSERVKLLAEVSDGSMGIGGKVGADYRVSDRSNAYLTYAMETESPDIAWRGRQGTLVSGASTRVSDQLRVFGEGRASNGAGPQSLTQAFGMDWAPNDRWNWGAKAEYGTVSDPLAGDLERRALGGSVGYKKDGLKYGGSLEWRKDSGNVSGERTTWLMRNTLGYQVDAAWRILSKFNMSRSSNNQGAFIDGNYREFVLASAYRPVDNDRWNTLFKYTNLNNVPTNGQLTPSGLNADYAQRSQVFAVDTIYDVLPWLSVGGKYAFRIGELKTPVAGGQWFSSRADLWVLRADVHFVKEWDALIEFRNLRATEAKDAKAGALLGLYRHFDKGIKAGVGYNFTNYSDDLTDLSYRSRGFFVNVLATY
jgi:outer membrane protein OmpA-like peptidoglycan-associated protein